MDIVKYLRANQEGWHDPDLVWVQVGAARVKEAADEIERLREKIRIKQERIDYYVNLVIASTPPVRNRRTKRLPPAPR